MGPSLSAIRVSRSVLPLTVGFLLESNLFDRFTGGANYLYYRAVLIKPGESFAFGFTRTSETFYNCVPFKKESVSLALSTALMTPCQHSQKRFTRGKAAACIHACLRLILLLTVLSHGY